MNIRQALLKEHSKHQTTLIVRYIGSDQELFDELMNLFLGDEYRVTQRAAWVVSYCGQAHPELLKPYLKRMIGNLHDKELHDAVKRNTLRVLQDVSIPEELQGFLFSICMSYLTSQEAVAIKVFAMTVAAGIAHTQPELRKELQLIIEDLLPYESAAFISRAKKTVKLLK